MKIMLCSPVNTGGHHFAYVKTLAEGLQTQNDIFLVLPEKNEEISCRQICFNNGTNWGTKTFFIYYDIIKNFEKIAEIEKPDIIYIEWGDLLYRYFGIGLKRLAKKWKVVATFHQINSNFIKNISIRYIFSKITAGVVHTNYHVCKFKQYGIQNIYHIEYPQLDYITEIDKKQARDFFHIPMNVPVLAAIGPTRYDKGLDILLAALKRIKMRYHLLVAGSESTFTKNYIQTESSCFCNQITLFNKNLNEKEFNLAVNVADIIVLPYRKIFDGASGPLTSGVWLKKCIVGPSHGSLGDIIKTNHIGYTFESENVDSLKNTIVQALSSTKFLYDDVALVYRKELSPEKFVYQYQNLFQNVCKEK